LAAKERREHKRKKSQMNTKKTTELILYKSKDGEIRMDVQLEQETLWLSLNQLADLFGRDKSVISRHLRNVYKEGELDRKATVAKNATVQNEAIGWPRNRFYNRFA